MITLLYQLSKENPNCFTYLEIQGHANYASKGQDLVCAAVSAIVNGAANFLQENYSSLCLINYQSAYVKFSPCEGKIKIFQQDKEFQSCLQMFFYQLKNISISYSDYLLLKEEK